MTDQGSDAMFAALADTSEISRAYRAERWRSLLEEWRCRNSPQADNEPGEAHPDPDEAPPADEPHDEYDPTPPE